MKELKPLERIRIRADEGEIRRFFARLDRETEHFAGFRILLGHHVILLRFPDEETAEKYRGFLEMVYTEQEGEPDGTITAWQGKMEDYLNFFGSSGGAPCLECAGESGSIRFLKWPDRILARTGNRQYIIMGGPVDEYVPPQAPFHWEFHNFAMTHGYALLHSGAVGLNGEGVMISAVGGGGKSTTVLSCLLDGMDYVSDDYLILDPKTVTAYPLYNSGILNEDSLRRLPELEPLVYGNVLRRPDRYIINLSRYRDRFCRGMKIRAVVFPHILPDGSPEREAVIRKDPRHTAKTQMLVSSARNNGFGVLQDQDALHSLFGAVSGLPSYELLLSPDRQSNCRAVRSLLHDLSERKPEKEE